MSDFAIFLFGGAVTLIVVFSTFLYTIFEFSQMSKHPERYTLKKYRADGTRMDEKTLRMNRSA